MIQIYKLFNPNEPHIVRYIGKTSMSLRERLQAHIDETKRYNKPKTYKIYWLDKLIKSNVKPSIEQIEECTEDNWQNREIYWINYYNSEYLTNTLSGGLTGGLVSKKVIQYSLDGVFIKIHESIKSAAKETNIGRASISSNLRKISNQAGDFIWYYFKEDFLKNIKPYKDTHCKKHKITNVISGEKYEGLSLKECLVYFNLKRVGNIHRCKKKGILYKKMFKIEEIK